MSLALPARIIVGWGRLARDKHSSLLRKSVNFCHKKVYSAGPGISRKTLKLE
jgi:hypothetical protein